LIAAASSRFLGCWRDALGGQIPAAVGLI
jgi:hypothetical protein